MVGVDGSEGSSVALRWAATMARYLDAGLVVVAVWQPSRSDADDEPSATERADLRRQLEDEWCAPAREIGAQVDTVVTSGNAGNALLGLADRHDAALVVVGKRGSGAISGLKLGSVSDFVAHRTDRPLAVIPEMGQAPREGASVVLGLKSEELWAAAFGGRVAVAMGADVVAVKVLDRSASEEQRSGALGDLEGEWTAAARGAGAEVRGRVVAHEHPADALITVAEEEDAALVVVGTREIHGWRVVRLGGATMRLLHHSDRPVVIVPPPRG